MEDKNSPHSHDEFAASYTDPTVRVRRRLRSILLGDGFGYLKGVCRFSTSKDTAVTRFNIFHRKWIGISDFVIDSQPLILTVSYE